MSFIVFGHESAIKGNRGSFILEGSISVLGFEAKDSKKIDWRLVDGLGDRRATRQPEGRSIRDLKRRGFEIVVLRTRLALRPAIPKRLASVRMQLRQGGRNRSFALVISIAETHSLAKKLAEKGYKIEYPEFPAGPQLLEALNVGSIDFGSIGESPPIFAKAAGASQVCVANLPNSGTAGEGRAILVNKNSPIHSVLDLRRKRVAFQLGSSAHNFSECLDPPWVAQWKILVHVLYFRTHKEHDNSNGIIVYVLA